MPIPIIVGAVIAAGATAGGGGLVLGGRGAIAIKKAKSRIAQAQGEYDDRRDETDARIEAANRVLDDYGQLQTVALDRTVKRMRDFLLRHEHQVRQHESLLVEGLDAQVGNLQNTGGIAVQAFSGVVGGVVGGAAAGAAAGSAATFLATSVGVASTGTAIGSLSGVAAQNAMLAWMGGGALATGGGGIAAGAMVMNSVVAGPAVLAMGFTVGKQGAKASTKAAEAEAAVAVAIAELDTFDEALSVVVKRSHELRDILDDLVERSVSALDELESEPFDPVEHVDRFQRAILLATAVRDVVATPVVDEAGQLTVASQAIVLRYQEGMEKQTSEGEADESA